MRLRSRIGEPKTGRGSRPLRVAFRTGLFKHANCRTSVDLDVVTDLAAGRLTSVDLWLRLRVVRSRRRDRRLKT
jgi:hypothetical protein